jgi:hypothetical protein
VSRIRGDVEDTVDTGLFQRFSVRLGIATKRPASAASAVLEFAATKANEDQLNLLLETGRVVDIIHGKSPAAEETNVCKLVEVSHGDHLGFHSAHGEACHGAMGLIGERAEVGIDVGDQLVHENCLEWFDIKVSEAAELDFVGHAVGHHDEEGPDLALGDQVIHDQIGVALVTPGSFILTPAVLQVQHRIALHLILVVIGRGVDKRPAGGVGALGGEENLLRSAMRNVLEGVEVLILSGNFDAAFPTSRTVKVQGAGIVECPTIDCEMVVVEAFIQRSCCGARPGAILAFREGSAPASAQAHTDALGLGSHNAKSGIALGVDLRILLAGLV